MTPPSHPRLALPLGVIGLCLAGAIATEGARAAWYEVSRREDAVLYVRSGTLLEKLALSNDLLLADAYWIRTLQHYGGTRRSKDPHKRYDLLYPLLEITTTLDPAFTVAYRFGAIFLAEPFPDGPGRVDQAIALLRKGATAEPAKWQYLQDIGFVYYWWAHDYREAARWFQRASEIAGSPWWLKSLAGTTLVQGGDRNSSRYLWQQLDETAEHDWLRSTARTRLAQLDALDQLDALAQLAARYEQRTGRFPDAWPSLVREGWLLRTPVDPSGTEYVLDAPRRTVTVSETSPLYPLPTGR